LEISEHEAERVLRKVGLRSRGEVVCRGTVDGETMEYPVAVAALNIELQPVLNCMLAPINKLLSEIPASIGAEVIEDGIFLTGGGALLSGMRSAVARESGIDAQIVADPLGAVIRGASTMLPFAATLDLWKVWGRSR
jgi:rod shape-determining protein MreB